MEASPTPSESSEVALKENKLLLKEAGTEMLGLLPPPSQE